MKASKLLKVLTNFGWTTDRQKGSHKVLKNGSNSYVFSFGNHEEIGRAMLSRVAKDVKISLQELMMG